MNIKITSVIFNIIYIRLKFNKYSRISPIRILFTGKRSIKTLGNTIKYNSNGNIGTQQDIKNNEILIGLYKLVKNNTLETKENLL